MNLFPEHQFDYVDVAVDRVKLAWEFHHYMNPDGLPMHLAFSGGKDSISLFFVCKKAAEKLGIPMGEMFHVQYNITCVDPPELVYFIRELKKEYPFIVIHHPKKTMWKLIEEKKMPPTRLVRYCCSELKEVSHIKGGYTLTGVRRAESVNRSARKGFEVNGRRRKDVILLNDNADDRRESEYCMQKNAYICNPIIDWSEEDVWNFIHHENLPYCKLYNQGYKRLGCIGCPMGSLEQRERDFSRWPGFKKCYIRAFERMLARMEKEHSNSRRSWKNGEDVMDWWLYGELTSQDKQEEKLEF